MPLGELLVKSGVFRVELERLLCDGDGLQEIAVHGVDIGQKRVIGGSGLLVAKAIKERRHLREERGVSRILRQGLEQLGEAAVGRHGSAKHSASESPR